MTPDEAIAEVNSRAAGRTQYEGAPLPWDEVLVKEIERLRKLVAVFETSATTRLERIVHMTAQQRELMAALDRANPKKARELAKKFERESAS